MVPKDIDVDGPRSPSDQTLPAQFGLDALDGRQQLVRRQGGAQLDHLVEIVVLLGTAHRGGHVQARLRRHRGAGQSRQTLPRPAKHRLPVALVGAEPQIDPGRGAPRGAQPSALEIGALQFHGSAHTRESAGHRRMRLGHLHPHLVDGELAEDGLGRRLRQPSRASE